MSSSFTRRRFLEGSGALLLSFSFGLGPGRPPLAGQSLPGSLLRHRRLDSWIRIDASGAVTVLTGKVEIGQGIKTALAQIVAEELDVDLARITMVTADTDRTPNEGYTSGSVSIEQSGAALRQVAAEARQILVELASERLGREPAELAVEDGRVSGGGDRSITYWELVDGQTLEREATGQARPKPPSEHRIVGRPVPRLDLPDKVFGEPSFVQDLRLPGMLHARIVRPPHYAARLEEVDTSSVATVEALAGVVRVVREGSFLGVIAEREEQAIRAAERLATLVRWSGSTELPARADLAAALRQLDSRETVVHQSGETAEPGEKAPARTLEAEYSKPYIAHASLGPSCAVALQEAPQAQGNGGRLTVWTHSQGVFPLRSALAKVLGREEESLRVVHLEGAGCYGHNGADDVALDAALLARALPGRPVRVQWSRQDELAWEPFGSAMAVKLLGALDAQGRIADWELHLWSCPHSTRPGRQASLLAGWHLPSPQPAPAAFNIPLPAGGADRNAVALYALPRQRVIEHFVADMPLRVSALRSLGAFGNVFAIESFLDELAALAGRDPVAFRLEHLEDERARAVIEAAARRAGWPGGASRAGDGGSARGRGFAFARYKNLGSYLALVVEVVVDRSSGQVRFERAVAAVDAGQVINPDGLRHQIEGGIVQAASWTLQEQVTWDGDGRITSVDWRRYPVLGFVSAPEVEVELLDRPDLPPLGVGEAAQGPTAAAIANAVRDATGKRLRDLPLLPERVRAG